MPKPTVKFIETMRGLITLTERQQTAIKDGFEEQAFVERSLNSGLERGVAGPMVWRDLVLIITNEEVTPRSGLAGVIEDGTIVVGELDEHPLVLTGGEFELLPVLANGERRMRYRLYCHTQDGRRSFLLYGFKRLAHHRQKFLPLAIWQETTTLYVTVYEIEASHQPKSDETPGALIAVGIIHVHFLDFIKQMLTFRSGGVQGLIGQSRNMGTFLYFFITSLGPVYLSKVKAEQITST